MLECCANVIPVETKPNSPNDRWPRSQECLVRARLAHRQGARQPEAARVAGTALPGAQVGQDVGPRGRHYRQSRKRSSEGAARQPPGRDKAPRQECDLSPCEPRYRALLGSAARARRGPSVRVAGGDASVRHVRQHMARREPGRAAAQGPQGRCRRARRARSLPLAELRARLAELPRDKPIVAYCRGPFCLMSDEAVTLLRKRGFRACKLADGVSEWLTAGMPLEARA